MKNLKLAVLTAFLLIMALALPPKLIAQEALPKVKANTPTGIVVHSYNLQSSDTVFTYYMENGNKYISGKIEVDIYDIIKGFVMMSYNDNPDDFNLGVSAGNLQGEPIFMGVKRNNLLYNLEPQNITKGPGWDNATPVDSILAGNLTIYKMTGAKITGLFEGELLPVPWWDAYNALCPVPGKTEIKVNEAVVGMGVFIPQFKPDHYKSFTRVLVKGNGTFYKTNTYTDTYKFGEGDPQLGEIIIQYTAVPFDGCDQAPLVYESKIIFTVDTAVGERTYNKGKFYKAVKSHLKVDKNGNQVRVYYDNTQTNDFDFPALKFILYSKPPMRELDTEESTNQKPDVMLTIPSGKKPYYIKVIAKDYGDFQNLYIR